MNSSVSKRIEIFNDTQEWIRNDADLADAVKYASEHTSVFYEDEYPSFEIKETDQIITVTGERSFEAAIALNKLYPGIKTAVMNFANAFHPGGGVKSGASAQEECLCRTSTLYPILSSESLKEQYYDYHKRKYSSKATDTLVYSEGVIICKTDTIFPERLPREEWAKVDIITIAAPDLRITSNIHVALSGDGLIMSDAELFACHVKRVMHLLTVAASKGAEALVLGAFGCGAFKNNPEVVAKAFKTAISEFPKVFKEIRFAVYCSPDNNENYEVFKRIISG